MAVNDLVDLLILLNRRGGEELEAQVGPEGVSLVEYLRDVVAARMHENDLYASLWNEFAVDAPSNRAEAIGALEAMVEGDAALAERLNGLLEDFNELTVAYGSSWQPPAEADGQALVGGLRDEVLALDEMDGLTEGEEARDLADLDGIAPGAAVADEGEDIGGDTYIHGRLLPDEDVSDEHRPGSLYDSGRDAGSVLDRNLTADALTAGDIEDALAPVRVALEETGRPAGLARHLDTIGAELGRAGSADTEQLHAALTALRDAHADLWDLLAWELLDLLPDFAPPIQRVLRGMGQPLA